MWACWNGYIIGGQNSRHSIMFHRRAQKILYSPESLGTHCREGVQNLSGVQGCSPHQARSSKTAKGCVSIYSWSPNSSGINEGQQRTGCHV